MSEAVAIAVVYTSVIYYLMAVPAFVAAIQGHFGLTPAKAGLVTSFNAYTSVASGFAASFAIDRFRRKAVIAFLLLAVATCEAATPFAASFGMLLAIRIVHGIFGGVAVAAASALIAGTRVPDRTYGVLLLYNALAGAIGLYAIPRLQMISGVLGFEFLAIFCAAGLLALPLVRVGTARNESRSPSPLAEAPPRSSTILRVALPLLALYCYQLFHNGLGSFALTVAQELELDPLSAANGIAVGKITGILGALIIVLIGNRFGRTVPLLFVAPIVLCEGLFIQTTAPGNSRWIVAQVLDGGVTYYALPLFLSTCASSDSTGRAAIWGPLASKIGIATGPLVGGVVGQALGFHTLMVAAISGMAGASLLAVAATRAQARAPSSGARKTDRVAALLPESGAQEGMGD